MTPGPRHRRVVAVVILAMLALAFLPVIPAHVTYFSGIPGLRPSEPRLGLSSTPCDVNYLYSLVFWLTSAGLRIDLGPGAACCCM
jgi:hypothetical protein